ncbi:molybdopterin-synthase adenylyltransferase MoeB [Jannaschia sp. Os4]|uniref:HesA/MoeB/ThiF family protein n=1 Tax=Jannaschia sp. Os4 TaxID=2807617 RepID=UPI00193A5C49|nr:molybdopterin-synthase adenylyltransferase MoeB [Jannaschia sp. Os4]MBM2575748.1 molybdopterin-synthase adenylyltransferase MoeB [Jannaschia sp. Os4]
MSVLVFAMAAGLWFLGKRMGTPPQARFLMLALLYVAVLFVTVALPEGNPIREGLGGPGQWIILGVGVALVVAYRRVWSRVRDRARAVEAERAQVESPQEGPFSEGELNRYARHIALREIGGPGQRRLKEAKVLVVGAGGLGSPALLYLGAAGVGTIGVIDDDVVSASNLQRQVIHPTDRKGEPKVHSAAETLGALNPHVEVRTYNRRLEPDMAAALVEDYDLVLDGCDDWATREAVNRACVATGVPLVSGAITQWEGQVTLYDPARGAPCLTCLFPKAPAPGMAPTCAEAGVVGALPGVIGSVMALEAIKEVAGAGRGLRGRLMLWDGLDAEVRTVGVARRADCPVCGAVAGGGGAAA